MSCEAFDIDAALEKCHAGTAWQRDLIHAQLIAAQADAFERAAKACKDKWYATQCADAIRALAKEAKQ
jgi:hypothetical protein